MIRGCCFKQTKRLWVYKLYSNQIRFLYSFLINLFYENNNR